MPQAYSYAVRAPTLSPSDNEECFVWFVPGSIAPHILGALEVLIIREAWDNDDNWREGKNAILSVMKGAYMLCASDLIAEIRALRGVREESESIPEDERTKNDYTTLRELKEAIEASNVNSRYTRATYNLLRNQLTGEATNGVEETEEGSRVEVTGIRTSAQATALSLYTSLDMPIEDAIPPKINAALRDASGESTAYQRLSKINDALYSEPDSSGQSAADFLAALLNILS